MTVTSSSDFKSEEFKDKVARDLTSMGIPSSRIVTDASRPSNVDEYGNIVDPDKKTTEVVNSDSPVAASPEKYERGLVDAYNAIKKIVRFNHVDGYDENELDKMFGETDPVEILSDFSIQQIMRNIHEFELYSLENVIFNKGDEVLVSEPGYAEDEYDRVVILDIEGDTVIGFNSDGKILRVNKLYCKLTGRSYDGLVNILETMDQEDE